MITRRDTSTGSGIHCCKEIVVVLGLLEFIKQEFHGIDRAHLHEDAPQHPHFGQRILIDQQLFLTGAGPGDINRREDTLVGELTVEDNFGVTRALNSSKITSSMREPVSIVRWQ